MGLTVTKTGPYFNGSGQPAPNNQTEVKFSQLRNTFRLNNPTGSISASELLRDIDTNSSDPIVPDATENINIASNTLSAIASGTIAPNLDWEVSQFFGAIKFFDVEQDASDTNANFNISALTEFNNNLGKTIKKKFTLRGTHTSTNTSIAAAQILSPAWNLTMEIHGNFYGAGGGGGVENDVSGKDGGAALSINSGRVTVDIQPSGRIYGGGGGGEFGADGTSGAAGTCRKDTTVFTCGGTLPACPSGFTLISSQGTGCCKLERWCSWGFCHNTCVASGTQGTCRGEASSLVPSTVKGGNGGHGRGHNYSGSLTGSDGQIGICPSCSDQTFTLLPGTGTCSGDGEDGGNGGDWGQNGGNTNASGNGGQGGSAISGSGFTVIGNNFNTVKGAI
tara:strand:- start:309 stop:1484 length:1176 start_codon:yes stop_codon:yes gene_type:complete